MESASKLHKVDARYVWTLILCSGSPLFSIFQGLNVILSCYFVLYWTRHYKHYPQLNILILYLVGILAIFCVQTYIFGWNSFPAIVNFCCKVFWGGSIFLILGNRFRQVYFKIITILAVISLIFWVFRLFNIIFPGITCGRASSIIVYNYITEWEGGLSYRNCGFPWEPGAFGCYLLFAFILYIDSLPKLWDSKRLSCIFILMAILSTMSTTSYIAIAIIGCILLFLKVRKAVVKYTWITIMLLGCLYIGKNLTFLSDKVSEQTESALEANGEFNSTRLGSLLFDFYYIQKHPLVGNGLNSKTRYADHQYLVKLWESGQEAKSGNGFSSIIANMGILFLILYFYIFNKRNSKYQSATNRVIISLSIMLLLFGEPLLNYPFLLGFPLIKLSTY